MSTSCIPTTLEDLKSYIDGLATFPVTRASQVRYGYTDSDALPMVQVNTLAGQPTYTTAGPSFWDSTFTVTIFHKSNFQALALARQIEPLLTGQHVTQKTTLCMITGYKVEQFDHYRFGVTISYQINEGV